MAVAALEKNLNSAQHTPAIRKDIQALRAYAVCSVIFFHFWPGLLPGGYIGVDVFFVISGYLISSHILRTLEKTRSFNFAEFWARRARRLLPASFLVLAVSILITMTLLDPQDRVVHLRSILGSALYIENWFLAADAVDYLAAEDNPPIAQHYWSLGVEEQFYLIWPILLLLGARLLGFLGGTKKAATAIILGMFAASFALCIVLTAHLLPYGFFSSPTRMWEFSAGALIASDFLKTRTEIIRQLLGMAGWAILIVSAFLLADVSFPGWIAIIPVTGAVFVILAGVESKALAESRILGLPVFQWLGDNSYSLYLWHWPAVILLPAVLGRPATGYDFIGAGLVCLVLAPLTKILVEDRLRFGQPWAGMRPAMVGLVTACTTLLVAGASYGPIKFIQFRAEQKQRDLVAAYTRPDTCLGAARYLNPLCRGDEGPWASDDLHPALSEMYGDTQKAYKCYQQQPTPPLDKCSFGRKGGLRIAVTGDSHAAMLLVPLKDLAETKGWEIHPFVGRGCVWSAAPDNKKCAPYWKALQTELKTGKYDLVIVTGREDTKLSPEHRKRLIAERSAAWREVVQAGIPVLALADNPATTETDRQCLSRHETLTERTCTATRPVTWGHDTIIEAGRASGSKIADFGKAYCPSDRCPLVLGGVIVYRDDHHVTATFAHTLASYLGAAIEKALRPAK